MARTTEKNERKRYCIAQAIFLILESLGLMSREYSLVGIEQWSATAPKLIKRATLAPTRQFIDAAQEGIYTCNYNGDIQVSVAGKIIGYDSLWRTLKNIVLLKTWPHDDSLAAIVEVAFASHAAKTLKGRLQETPDVVFSKNRAMEFLLNYKKHLELSSEPVGPLEYRRLVSDFGGRGFIDETDDVSLEEIKSYVDNSVRYLKRYIGHCESRNCLHIFEVFRIRLDNFKARAIEEREYDGREQFSDLLSEIRAFAFQTEESLLAEALRSSGPLNIYFSDSGFADAGASRPVWVDDDERRSIVKLLLRAKRRNNQLNYHRVLLLDSLNYENYKEEQIRLLVDDI